MKWEQRGEDMVDILRHINRYVPQLQDGTIQPLLFGGDMLTRERSAHARDSKLQSATPESRLQGIVPKCEDWHALVTFHQVCTYIDYAHTLYTVSLTSHGFIHTCHFQVLWNKLYHPYSLREKGTLSHLETLLNRKLPRKVKDGHSHIKDFLDVVLDAHILAAALEFFGLEDLQLSPSAHCPPADLHKRRLDEQSQWLSDTTQQFLKEYVFHSHTISTDITGENTTPSGQDHVFNYASAFMGMALLGRNFHDASREGDGSRVIRIWKILLLHFKDNKRTKYSVEAFNLLSQINATFTPRLSHQLMWNRTCNPRGGPVNNVQLDLQLEHLNRLFKDDLNTFRSNITEHSVQRSSCVLGQIKKVFDNLDDIVGVKHPSGQHIGPDLESDCNILVQALKREKILVKVPGRAHKYFENIMSDPLYSLKKPVNVEKLYKWLSLT